MSERKAMRINLSDTSDSDLDLAKNKPLTPLSSSKEDAVSAKSKSSSIINKLKSAFKTRTPSPSPSTQKKQAKQQLFRSSDDETSRSNNGGRESSLAVVSKKADKAEPKQQTSQMSKKPYVEEDSENSEDDGRYKFEDRSRKQQEKIKDVRKINHFNSTNNNKPPPSPLQKKNDSEQSSSDNESGRKTFAKIIKPPPTNQSVASSQSNKNNNNNTKTKERIKERSESLSSDSNSPTFFKPTRNEKEEREEEAEQQQQQQRQSVKLIKKPVNGKLTVKAEKYNHDDEQEDDNYEDKKESKKSNNNNQKEKVAKERPKSAKVVSAGKTGKKILTSGSSSTSRSSSASSTSSSRSRNKSQSRNRSRSSSDSRSRSRSSSSRSERKSKRQERSPEQPIRVNFDERKPPLDKTKRNSNTTSSGKPTHKSKHSEDEEDYADDKGKRRPNNNNNNGFKSRNLNETYTNNSNSEENEITDVSPLSSPRHHRHHNNNKHQKNKNKEKIVEEELDTNRINTNVFYDALHTEFNKKMDAVLNNLGSNVNQRSRPVSSTVKLANSNSMNDLYSTGIDMNNSVATSGGRFGSGLAFNLDEEKRRLLIKIIREKELEKQKSSNVYLQKPMRLTSAALNRQREQQRIERENQKILKRLLHVKGSKTVSRDEQMKDYERNFGIASLNYTRSMNGGSGRASSSGFRSAFTNSMSSLNKFGGGGNRNNNASVSNSRVSSAKSTAKGGNNNLASMDASELLRHAAKLSQKRPDWVERW